MLVLAETKHLPPSDPYTAKYRIWPQGIARLRSKYVSRICVCLCSPPNRPKIPRNTTTQPLEPSRRRSKQVGFKQCEICVVVCARSPYGDCPTMLTRLHARCVPRKHAMRVTLMEPVHPPQTNFVESGVWPALGPWSKPMARSL